MPLGKVKVLMPLRLKCDSFHRFAIVWKMVHCWTSQDVFRVLYTQRKLITFAAFIFLIFFFQSSMKSKVLAKMEKHAVVQYASIKCYPLLANIIDSSYCNVVMRAGKQLPLQIKKKMSSI